MRTDGDYDFVLVGHGRDKCEGNKNLWNDKVPYFINRDLDKVPMATTGLQNRKRSL
jgi:hypothetical protein